MTKDKNGAYTSTRQIPAAFSEPSLEPVFKRAQVNLDWGGGKYDDATKFLKDTYGCINLVYDPYNRSTPHNLRALSSAMDPEVPLGSITCLNVLNVIQSGEKRLDLLTGLDFFKRPSDIIIQVYEGNGSGIPSAEPLTQNNQKLSWYLPEIKCVLIEAEWDYKILGAKKNILHLHRK